jgi:hypothetical protein
MRRNEFPIRNEFKGFPENNERGDRFSLSRGRGPG